MNENCALTHLIFLTPLILMSIAISCTTLVYILRWF